MKTNKGFAPIALVLILVAILAVGGVAYYAGKNSNPAPQNTEVNNLSNQNTQTTSSTSSNPINANVSANIPSDWNQYKNPKYGFEFFYPPTFSIKDVQENRVQITDASGKITLTFWVNPPAFGVEGYDFYKPPIDKIINGVKFSIGFTSQEGSTNPDFYFASMPYSYINGNNYYITLFASPGTDKAFAEDLFLSIIST